MTDTNDDKPGQDDLKLQEVDEEKLKKQIEDGSKKVSDKHVRKIVESKDKFEKKLKDVPDGFQKAINRLKLLFELIAAYWKGEYREIPYISIAMAVFAVLYFLWPFDLIPDVIPVVGYVDDAAVVALVVVAIQEDLRAFCKFKGYDPAKYFD